MKRCPACTHPFAGPEWRCPRCGHLPPRVAGYYSFAQPTAGDGFRPEYFAELATVEAGHFWFRARNRVIISTLKKFFPYGRTLLEVGCGTGYVLAGLARACPELKLNGSEYFAEGLPFAAQRVPAADFYQVDARDLPFVEEFDIVGAFDMLEHVDEDDVVLRQFWQAVRPGGGVVVTVPQHRWLWSEADAAACHVRRYERAELVAKVTAAGFRVDYVTSFVSLLLPLMWLMRRRRGCSAAEADRLQEFRLHPLVNGSLAGVLWLEWLLLRLGIGFPLGGSLLLVARKMTPKEDGVC